MQLDKLFKVLVVGGAALVIPALGCMDSVDDSQRRLTDVDAGAPIDASPDGVSGWLNWFAPVPDAAPPDAALPDAGAPDAGVTGWLAW